MPTPTTANRNYPLPHPENELDTDVQRLVSALQSIDADVASLLISVSEAALGTHGHVIGDVTGLQAALNDKAAAGHTHAINDLTDVNITGAPAGRPLTTQVGGGVGIGPAPMTQAQVDAAISAAILGKLDAAGPTVQSGYVEIKPYNASYDDGSLLQSYYNGNGRKWKVYGKASGGALVPITLELTGGISTTLPITVSGNEVWHAGNQGAGSGLNADLLDGREGVVIDPRGQQTIWLPAGSMIPQQTNGAERHTEEATSNNQVIDGLLFDPATNEFAQFFVQMPKSWDRGAIIAQFIWTHGGGGSAFVVRWALQACALSNSDPLDAAWSAAVVVSDSGGTPGDCLISPETGAVTVAGSPGAEELVYFRVYRDAVNGSDTLDIDAKLIGVKIHYTLNAPTDS